MFRDYGTILTGDALTMLRTLPEQSAQCCVTSPPYWGLRNYCVVGQRGLESTPEDYVAALVPVFKEVWRVLRNDGTLWLNLGDSYIGYHGNKYAYGAAASSDVGAGGLKNKDLAGIPWRVAFALQDAGWYLRCDCIWAKPNPMPESVRDRPTRAHEYLFLLSKAKRYYYDNEIVREPAVATNEHDHTGQGYLAPGQPIHKGNRARGVKRRSLRPGIDTKGGNQGTGKMTYPLYTRNRRSVWSVPTRGFPGAHFATFPPDLIRPCILAGCPIGGTVLDPFFGTGTVGVVCVEEARRYLGIEINPDYVAMAERRIEAAEVKARAPRQASLLHMDRAI